MVLPRNITQIGEINSSCKVYVEDYVVSYMKQINQLAMDKPMAVAIYGIKKEENGVDYLFVYGGAQLDYLCRECRHLSQAQLQEIDRNRKKYFQEYSFLGYCLLTGEMLEGFYIYEQGICRYTAGYARFYEKNDSMLAFMLDNRLTEVTPEVVDETKYAMVRSRQEERKRKTEEEAYAPRQSRESKPESEPAPLSFQYRFAKGAVAAVFCLVCVLALFLVSQNQEGNKSVFSAETWKELGGLFAGEEEETQEQQPVSSGQVDKLVIENKLNQAILAENEGSAEATTESEEATESGDGQALLPTEASEESQIAQSTVETVESTEASVESTEAIDSAASSEGALENTQVSLVQGEVVDSTVVTTLENPVESTQTTVESTQQETQETEEVVSNTEVVQLTSYTIMAGDTLIGISTRMYGTEHMVSEICRLNNISNPDDIKVGAKILLP